MLRGRHASADLCHRSCSKYYQRIYISYESSYACKCYSFLSNNGTVELLNQVLAPCYLLNADPQVLRVIDASNAYTKLLLKNGFQRLKFHSNLYSRCVNQGTRAKQTR